MGERYGRDRVRVLRSFKDGLLPVLPQFTVTAAEYPHPQSRNHALHPKGCTFPSVCIWLLLFAEIWKNYCEATALCPHSSLGSSMVMGFVLQIPSLRDAGGKGLPSVEAVSFAFVKAAYGNRAQNLGPQHFFNPLQQHRSRSLCIP